ncbi:MAG: PD40 domain-containing protein, partial [Phycisphaerae bacterium]|nr:PD40 domain-containing protein [Phycisphaerae bacterium]
MRKVQSPSLSGVSRVLFSAIVVLLMLPMAVYGGVAGAGGPAVGEALRFDNPSYSPDGKWLAMSDGRRDALYLYNIADKTVVEMANSPSGGYAYNWAPDSTRVGFKRLIPSGQGALPLQVPVFFDIGTQTLVSLCPPVQRAGVPSLAATGQIAFSVDEELRIADVSGTTLKTFALGHYANLTPISPDGTKVAYNDRDDRICVIDLATGERKALTSDENAYFNPVWSPDSSRLIVSTVSGQLKVVEISSGTVHELDEGDSPSWGPDSQTVFYNKVDRVPSVKVNSADLCRIQFDGSSMTNLTRGSGVQAMAGRVAPDAGKMTFVSLADGELYEAPLIRAAAAATMEGPAGVAGGKAEAGACSLGAAVKLDVEGAGLSDMPAAVLDSQPDAQAGDEPIAPEAQTTISKAVPYLHQVYDTPDNFNGHSACGASSAMMAISYYERLPYWDVTCSSPYSHVSHYGRYVCQIYSYNGYTYNIAGRDPNGNWFYGGFGYIIQNNWEDTKGHMRDYFINHSISSSVDWSPTWS